MKKKTKIIISIVNLLLVIYLITIAVIAEHNGWYCYILGFKNKLITLLIVMFIFELLSTITFQTRIWLTSKDMITAAAIVGSLSWVIAGIQGLLLINGEIYPLNDIATFFVKMPPVFVATFSGIILNYEIKRIKS